jgi:M6 family metalloprotease-like protein
MRMSAWLMVMVGIVSQASVAAAQKSADAGRDACVNRLNPLVIQVEFADVARKANTAFVRQRFLQEPDGYIREMSYGKTCLDGEITKKWYRLPLPIKQYWVPWQNLNVDKGALERLVTDSVGLAERDVDVSRYDFVVLALAATALQWGNQGLNTYPGLLGIADDSSLKTPGGKKIRGGVAIYAQSANLGKIVHNMAHIIAGVKDGRRVLPDMYDQDSASASAEKSGPLAVGALVRSQMHMGAWDPMSCNQCLQRPGIPGMSAWTKLRLGWIDESKVRTVNAGERVEVSLGPLTDATAKTLAVRLPVTAQTYYLVENRQLVGHDTNLPASGVLIMLSDDRIPEPRKGRAPVRLINADPSVPNLDGAAFDMGKNEVFLDGENGVTVRLLRKDAAAYNVRIERR